MRDTVTVYNKYVDAGVEKWQRTVLHGVFWNAIKGAVTRKTGLTTADSVQLIIPFAVGCKRSYFTPNTWNALPDKSGSWTLRAGDVVVKGDITQDIIRSTKELQNLDDVLTITSVDTMDVGGPMSHWEVSGK